MTSWVSLILRALLSRFECAFPTSRTEREKWGTRQHLAAGGSSVAVNLGTGRGNSVKEVINEVERVTGRPVPRRIGPRRPGDPPELVADPRAAEKLLNWKATRSLDNIVTTAWKWMQSRGA